jgi:threonine dehydratase
MNKIPVEEILKAHQALKGIIKHSPLERNDILSERYGCNVFLKREDLQIIRSFKIRGAYNLIQSTPREILQKGVVCASAGNHAQGVAYSCKILKIPGKIYMPTTTPKQKISQVKRHGGEYVDILLTGDTFDASYEKAKEYCDQENMVFVHPFDDPLVIAGQGTIGIEIMNDMEDELMSGVGTYIKNISPKTKIIGVEPLGASSMKKSLDSNELVTLDTIDKFVDGAAVKRVGEITFRICQEILDDIIAVPEGRVCTKILDLYNEDAIVVEPAGALPIAALDQYKEQIAGKNVVCILSGGNNDIERTPEIKEKSLFNEGLKHYFIVRFPQRPGALREFVAEVLDPHDDITRFEYTKSNNKEKGPTLIGIELNKKEDYEPLINKMTEKGFQYTVINDNPELFELLI